MFNNLFLIHHDHKAVETALNQSVAETIVPALRKLLRSEAKAITEQFEADDSPLAVDAATDELMYLLAGFICLAELERDGNLAACQLKKSYAKWWFGLE